MRDPATPPGSIIETARRVMTGPTGTGALASLAIVVGSGIVAPGDGTGIWTWLRVLAIWLLLTFSLGTIIDVGSGNRTARTVSPLIVWGALALVIVIALTFNVLALSLTVLGMTLLLLTVPTSNHALTFWTVAVTIIPLWVWSVFEAWDRWLLMLVPIAAVGLVSLEHAVRAGHAGGDVQATMAAWIGLLALAAATILVAILGPIDPTWSTAAGLAVAILAPIDLALARASSARISPVVLPALALVLIAFGWMVAL